MVKHNEPEPINNRLHVVHFNQLDNILLIPNKATETILLLYPMIKEGVAYKEVFEYLGAEGENKTIKLIPYSVYGTKVSYSAKLPKDFYREVDECEEEEE